ncbi:hypothetical protein FKM82_007355 [Ascaphus truei]
MNLASLKLSGSRLARKATMKLMVAKRLRYPSMHQKAVGEPSLHSTMITPGWVWVLYSGKGGEITSQEIHKRNCKNEQRKMIM